MKNTRLSAGGSVHCRQLGAEPPHTTFYYHQIELMLKKNRLKALCNASDLINESSVEQFFVIRLLQALGYTDSQIKSKEALETVKVSTGRKKVSYRPDFVLTIQRRPRIVIDAKSPNEALDEWIGQCGSYCHEINKHHNDNPAEIFILTNGLTTSVYLWDKAAPVFTINLADCVPGTKQFDRLAALVGAAAITKKTRSKSTVRAGKGTPSDVAAHEFVKAPIDTVNLAFAWCHQHIYKKDNLSQAAAFMEFVKLMFMKLLSDKDVHQNHEEASTKKKYTVPAEDVRFSTAWIDSLSSSTPSPIADVEFIKLRRLLEEKIRAEQKKRIFEPDEELKLSAETIRGVVEKLEHLDLYSIDADLNGRLFETFLNSTMRGKDLGQYFTPRSIVKLAYVLTNVQFGKDPASIPVILDPCCGSGGFLIDALWHIWGEIDKKTNLSAKQKNQFKLIVATEKLVGIDVGRDPHLARIARINMYLHGDGGSRVYEADSLDKSLPIDERWTAEKKREVNELRDLLGAEDGCVDLIMTNPPFSKVYETKHAPEKRILSDYTLALAKQGTKDLRPTVKSNILFIERYYDFLKPGGHVVAVIDDSVLGGSEYKEVRQFMRERFVIEGVVSLPGDAFQRSHARVKTSILVMRKKVENEEQGACFMYYCSYVGLDDTPRQRSLPSDRLARHNALDEVAKVKTLWQAYIDGTVSKKWLVNADRLTDRLDVKSCLPKPRRLQPLWTSKNKEIKLLRDLVDVYDADNLDDNDVVDTQANEEMVCLLRVRYDGEAERGEEKATSDVEYDVLLRVHENDIVISNINAVHGAIAVVPSELDGCVVSNEYTICRARPGIDPKLVWLLARSPEARSDLILLASGMGRTRIRWENARDLMVALPSPNTSRKAVDLISRALELSKEAEKARKQAEELVYEELGLANQTAWKLIDAFRPPK